MVIWVVEERVRLACSIAGCAKAVEGACVAIDVLPVLALELSDEVVDEAVIEVLAAEHVFGRGLGLKYPFLDGEEGDVEGATTEVKDEDVALPAAAGVLVKVVGNGFIDHEDDVEVGNGVGILGAWHWESLR